MAFFHDMNRTDIPQVMKALEEESEKAFSEQEIPVSAVLLLKDGTLLRDHNRCEQKKNPLCHAEIEVLNQGFRTSKYLKEGVLFVTLEPCLACLGAILKSGVSDLYYDLSDEKEGAFSHYHVFADDRLRIHRFLDPVAEKRYAAFFLSLREKKTS